MIESGPRHGKVIALLTTSTVLAIDIEEALISIGYAVLSQHDFDLHELEIARPNRFDAAIVELQSQDACARLAIDWLTARKIPTIIISTTENSEASQMPGVVASFVMPLCVDSILPAVVEATDHQKLCF